MRAPACGSHRCNRPARGSSCDRSGTPPGNGGISRGGATTCRPSVSDRDDDKLALRANHEHRVLTAGVHRLRASGCRPGALDLFGALTCDRSYRHDHRGRDFPADRPQPSESDGIRLPSTDISMAWTDFEYEALAASSPTAFGAARAPMAQAEDLIVFKAIAGRPKDIQDATTLLVLYPALDRARARRRVSQLAALADDPAPMNILETAIAAAEAVPRLRTTKPRPRRRAPHKRGRGDTKPRKPG